MHGAEHGCGATSDRNEACSSPMQAMPALGSVGAPHDCPLIDGTDDAQAEIFFDEQVAGELLHLFRGHGVDPMLDLLGSHLAAKREFVTAEANHPARGRLERKREIALDVLLGEVELRFVDRLRCARARTARRTTSMHA